MKWDVLYSGKKAAQHHMDKDQQLLNEICITDQPILHFYEWDGPSATHGYFTDPSLYLDLEVSRQKDLNIARRPTGGGIVFHVTDLAFSVLIPASHPAYSTNTLENYAFINRHVAQAIVKYKKELRTDFFQIEKKTSHQACQHFCMANPTIYDVMVDGKKVGGAAQRRTRFGFLHQGTISLTMPQEEFLKAVLKQGNEILDAMKCHTYALIERIPTNQQLKDAREELQQLLIAEFTF